MYVKDTAKAVLAALLLSFRKVDSDPSLQTWGGDTEAARPNLEEALRLQPDDFGVLYNVACNYAEMGDVERALDALDHTIATGAGSRSWIEHDPDFAKIRELPRFKQIMARLQ